ncbi:hypothetical protein MAPG_05315 [Magnaporthiopsis poae ATCC 64411]|uniref:Uncharacterized protein n=1 Tax=Magnaporthiopsis poae (strain ATCC 64411 / 73-15) TaxID=644358 RepID=A0A0C4DZ27_MAGP6|nr:hypothetical protein MAPG_05315 [Magnaporthiopsis poae ATCC 64411]
MKIAESGELVARASPGEAGAYPDGPRDKDSGNGVTVGKDGIPLIWGKPVSDTAASSSSTPKPKGRGKKEVPEVGWFTGYGSNGCTPRPGKTMCQRMSEKAGRAKGGFESAFKPGPGAPEPPSPRERHEPLFIEGKVFQNGKLAPPGTVISVGGRVTVTVGHDGRPNFSEWSSSKPPCSGAGVGAPGAAVTKRHEADELVRVRQGRKPAFYRVLLLLLAALPPPFAPLLADPIIGDGESPTAMIDKDDIGPYVARIITDPRTLNRSVFAYGEVTTQNAMWAEVEAATGREVPRDVISAADLEARIAKLRIAVAADPTSVGPLLDLAMSQYRHSRHVRGDNVPDRARYLGYLDGKTLYPDLKCTSLRDFIRDVAAGKRDHRIYVGRDVVADATQHRN